MEESTATAAAAVEQPRDSGTSSVVLVTAAVLLTTCVVAAVTGVLPGYLLDNGGGSGGGSGAMGVATGLLVNDVVATIGAGALGYAFVHVVSGAVKADSLAARDARKIIHTLSAPLFVLLWPLFSASPSARFFAALVPLMNAIRLYRAGYAHDRSEAALAAAVSRSGDAREAVGGPFIYVCMLAASVLLFWRDSPVGIVAMATLAAGDGMADLVGRRYGANNRWPGTQKSVAGTAAFWVSSTVTATGLLAWMQYTGCLALPLSLTEVARTIAGITLASAVLEISPWFGDDNYTVPLSAAVLTLLFLHA